MDDFIYIFIFVFIFGDFANIGIGVFIHSLLKLTPFVLQYKQTWGKKLLQFNLRCLFYSVIIHLSTE